MRRTAWRGLAEKERDGEDKTRRYEWQILSPEGYFPERRGKAKEGDRETKRRSCILTPSLRRALLDVILPNRICSKTTTPLFILETKNEQILCCAPRRKEKYPVGAGCCVAGKKGANEEKEIISGGWRNAAVGIMPRVHPRYIEYISRMAWRDISTFPLELTDRLFKVKLEIK